MKKFLLLGAAIAAFTFTSFASDTLLSPRAACNQNKIVSAVPLAQPVPASAVLLSPRGQDNQITGAKGVASDFNPAVVCAKTMNGSPKAVSECTSHTTMPGCMAVAALK
jgi:hypothetical protein